MRLNHVLIDFLHIMHLPNPKFALHFSLTQSVNKANNNYVAGFGSKIATENWRRIWFGGLWMIISTNSSSKVQDFILENQSLYNNYYINFQSPLIK